MRKMIKKYLIFPFKTSNDSGIVCNETSELGSENLQLHFTDTQVELGNAVSTNGKEVS